MKAVKSFRHAGPAGAEEVFGRATRLAPDRKSGKERYSLRARMEEEAEESACECGSEHESALGYYDDEP